MTVALERRSTRPIRWLLVVLALTASGVRFVYAANEARPAGKPLVYVGTYTNADSQGIYVCEFDPATGSLGAPRVAASASETGLNNPSFVAPHANGRWLYAVSEVDDYDDNRGGAVAALAVDPADGRLTLLNHRSTRGAAPCHVSVDRQGQFVLVANYTGGSVAVFPIEEDGRVAAASSFVPHHGSSVNPQRQEAAHAHSIHAAPDNRFVLAADLGIDQIVSYRFDAEAGQLAANDAGSGRTPPGAGPRHLAFHPNGRRVYANGELTSTVLAFRYDAERGMLEQFQELSTLPADFDRSQNTIAEVQVHPSGRFVYVSNRGHDSIAMYAVDGEDGTLAALGQHPTGGQTPRNFGIDPSGRWLLAANQNSGTVVVHRIDPATGKLERTEHEAAIPMPVCVKFLPR